MGGCSAPNCSNSTTIGKQLFRFPKDPVRMKKWVINCRRDFIPTTCSRLCEDHFELSQFEEIARSPAGGKKLKPNAIPTVFDVPDPPSPILMKEVKIKLDYAGKRTRGDHGYARKQLCSETGEPENNEENNKEDYSCRECDRFKAHLEQQYLNNAILQRQVEEMKKKLNKLNKIEKSLQNFLFDDQIRALSLTKRSRRAVWSQNTVQSARRIRAAVGGKGYEFLRELGYPLPSYRTLCNRVEPTIIAPPAVPEEMAEICAETQEKCALALLLSSSPGTVVGS
ncbi:52 kDa repressor of the inhibitor of the protein kinase-like [Acipenser oxyrinchus oxyrinchus]|uniref:THAP domain-containing protein 1 n=1 Tax=Acipenser oxyrinchus oxyrinchus TaxID=40147 RepID=A0AAD8D6J1_ACIOX|nr:52 kDa repressor of the inhibitor of the protein kinase-like [Acipenser oxyrinchus oxyrinchus]